MASRNTKQAPVVRQTKTSICRTLNAHPLLFLRPDKFRNVDIPPETIRVPNFLARKYSLPISVNNIADIRNAANSAHNSNKGNNKGRFNGQLASTIQCDQRPSVNCSKLPKNINNEINCNGSRQKWTSPKPLHIRRSLSCNDISNAEESTLSTIITKSVTEENCDIHNDLPVFKTPNAYKRRSVKFLTPGSVKHNRAIFHSSTPFTSALETKNASFDLLIKGHKLFDSEDKENCNDNSPIKCCKKQLEDLYKLIIGGYPLDKCENCLINILENDASVRNDPIFWECRAAIEEKRASNLEENQDLDQSLHDIVDKFSQFQLQSPYPTKPQDKSMTPSQIIKSKSIKFALEEKLQNQGESQYVLQPVRRSMRKRTSFINTVGVRMCTSISELENEVKDKMVFKPNDSLL